MQSFDRYLLDIAAIAKKTGDIVMRYYDGDTGKRLKKDATPVTDADMAAHDFILTSLAALTPDIPVVSEEDEYHVHTSKPRFWLVDPLDGTKSFIRGSGEFTVNIGLIEDGQPVMGVVHAPRLNTHYYGSIGQGAFRQEASKPPEAIMTRPTPLAGMTVVISHSHLSRETEAYLETQRVAQKLPISSSFKFCVIAEGGADLYPRFGPTMEWDTAAGHAVLRAAGGRVETVDGQPLTYGKPGFENPHFIAFASGK